MGTVSLRWTGDRLQFVGETGYGVAVEVGGDPEGRGAKPSDLLPLSLAACTGYDIVVILRKQRQDLREMRIVVTSTQDPDPPWTFRAIHMAVELTGTIEPGRAARAIDLAERRYCSVAATLRPIVDLTHSFTIMPAP
jgi:putative redox protein